MPGDFPTCTQAFGGFLTFIQSPIPVAFSSRYIPWKPKPLFLQQTRDRLRLSGRAAALKEELPGALSLAHPLLSNLSQMHRRSAAARRFPNNPSDLCAVLPRETRSVALLFISSTIKAYGYRCDKTARDFTAASTSVKISSRDTIA